MRTESKATCFKSQGLPRRDPRCVFDGNRQHIAAGWPQSLFVCPERKSQDCALQDGIGLRRCPCTLDMKLANQCTCQALQTDWTSHVVRVRGDVEGSGKRSMAREAVRATRRHQAGPGGFRNSRWRHIALRRGRAGRRGYVLPSSEAWN